MQTKVTDVSAGGVFIAVGLIFGLTSLLNLRLSGAFGSGPGLFPLALSIALCGFGAWVALSAFGKPPSDFGAIAWRGIVMTTAAILFFAFSLDPLGLTAAVFGCVLLAAASTRRSMPLGALVTAVAMTIFCIAIFKYALGLNLRVLGPWLGG